MDLREFFLPYFERAIDKSGVKISDEAKEYLFKLVVQNALSQNYNSSIIVADLLCKISESEDRGEKASLYVQIGDFSLYSVGFFIENILRRNVGVEYYLQRGSSAYYSAYLLTRDSSFCELSRNYSDVALVLGSVSDQIFSDRMKKTVNIFECYRNNKSLFLKRRLASLGMMVKEEKDE
jgi:hypothetical protein